MWQANDNRAKASDGALGDLSADIRHVLAQLVHNLLDIALGGDLGENLQLEVLDVGWLVVFDEELLVFGFEHKVGTSEHEKMNVAQDVEGHLITFCCLARSHKGDHGCLHS